MANGLLNLNKPTGMTSRDVVNRVSRLARKLKVGHAGTLDPLASGVLVVCLGSSTRLIESIQSMPKTYRATIRLGATSDTLDADGCVEEAVDPPIPTAEAVDRALLSQIGTIVQRPPAYSALKIQGVRAYELARNGRAVEPAPRPVTIQRIRIVSYQWPRLELEIDCGGGTYIRSIARDLGESLGCGGLIEGLVRTRIGPFLLETAVDPNELTADSLARRLIPPLEAVPDLPRITLSADQVADVARGRIVPVDPWRIPETAESRVALLDPMENLIAIGERSAARDSVQPRKVLIGGPEVAALQPPPKENVAPES